MKIIFLLLSLLFCISLNAQIISDSINNLMVTDGLPHSNNLYDVAYDQHGNYYFASHIGLLKFDGKHWQHIRVGSHSSFNHTQNVAIDSSGRVWVSTMFHTYIMEDSIFDLENVFPLFTDMIVLNSKELLAASQDALLSYNTVTLEETIVYETPDNLLIHFKKDKDDHVWALGYYNNLLYRVYNKNVTEYIMLNGFDCKKVNDYSFIDTTYYALHTIEGLQLFNNGSYKQLALPFNENADYVRIEYLLDSTLIVSSEKYGVYAYNTEEWKRIDENNPFYKVPFSVKRLANDSLVICYGGDGVSMGKVDSLTHYYGAGLEEVGSLCYTNDGLYIGARDGFVSKWNGFSVEYTDNILQFSGSSKLILNTDTVLYNVCSQGIFELSENTWECKNDEYNIPDTQYYCGFFNEDNKLFLGSRNGVYIADSSKILNHFNNQNSPIGNVVWAILEGNNEILWMGSWKGTGSEHYKEGKLFSYNGHEFVEHDIPDSDGTPHTIFNDSRGNIWVHFFGASYYNESLFKYDGKEWKAVQFDEDERINKRGLSDLWEDQWGDIWGIAWGFVYRYSGEKWYKYGTEIGMPLVTQTAITGDNKGHVFIGTVDMGTYVLQYEPNSTDIKPQAFSLSNIEVYPNPSQGIIYYKIEGQGTKEIKVFNTVGQLVYSTAHTINENKLNLEFLAKGTYVLQVIQNKHFATIIISIN